MGCLILSGKKNIKSNRVITLVILIHYINNSVYEIELLLIFEFLVFLIIGRNNPKIYSKIITRDTINIDLTAFIFIKIIFPLNEGKAQQNYKVYD